MSSTIESPTLQTYACLPVDLLRIDVPVLLRTDFDGTAGINGTLPQRDQSFMDVQGSMGLFLRLADSGRFDIEPEAIVSQWRQTEAEGNPFIPTVLIKDRLSAEDYSIFLKQYAANEFDFPLLYTDYLPYQKRFDEAYVPNDILTHGVPDWQYPKTAAAGVTAHVEVTSERSKGFPIDKMYNADTNSYDMVAVDAYNQAIALMRADKAILVDDNPHSFNGLSRNTEGNHVNRDEPKKPGKIGTVDPTRVQTVSTLNQVILTDDMRPKLTDEAAEVMARTTQYMSIAAYALLNA